MISLEALDSTNKAAMQKATLLITFMIKISKSSVTVESVTGQRIASDFSLEALDPTNKAAMQNDAQGDALEHLHDQE